MRILGSAASIAFLSAMAPPAAQSGDEVRAAAIATVDALARFDADQLAGALGPGFVAIDTRGGLRSSAEFLSDVRAFPVRTARPRLRREWSGIKVIAEGDEATFVGRATWQPEAGQSGHATYSTLYTQRWNLIDGRWRLVQLQISRLPPPPEIVNIPSGSLTLKAMLFRPRGNGPFPAVVYAHGNEPDPSDLFETVGPALAARGYLVLGVHRRGSGLSADQAANLLRRLSEIERTEGVEARSKVAITELEGPQLDDVAAAVTVAKAMPEVDPVRVFVIGNSFGGVLALLSAERGLGLKGAADFAGSAMNWERSPLFRDRMARAARNAKVPVFLAQAENDYSTAPTRELGTVLLKAGKAHRAKVFPAFGLTAGEGHGFGVDGVEVWFDEVMEYLDPPASDRR